MKALAAVLISCLMGTCPVPPDADAGAPGYLAKLATYSGRASSERQMTDPFDEKTLAGNYLASQFAQHRHDWKRAGDYLDYVIEQSPDDIQLLNKSMVLAMGAGQAGKAVSLAQKVLAQDPQNALASLFVALDKLHGKDYAGAAAYIKSMPPGNLSEFIFPLLESWSQAGVGDFDVEKLLTNTIHIYHAVLIADFVDKKADIENMLRLSLGAQGLTLEDLIHIADAYVHIGKNDTAIDLYGKILQEWPEHTAVAKKLNLVREGKTDRIFRSVESPEQGIALALYDMSRLLFQEQSDESARVFSYMALFLDPALTEAEILLANIETRNQQYDRAIAHYMNVSPDSDSYLESRRLAAGLLDESNRTDEALAGLNALFTEYGDVESLIQIGDIYRKHENFSKAIEAYNQAAESLGPTIPREYWQLHYMRGMSYEQMGQWDKAEFDLKAALDYQPEHPFVLNYLGYAWADQGVNLAKSLEMIRKAALLRPDDGYITDSLGWVLYRLGKYEEAVPHMEKAVELMPYDSVVNDHLGDSYWQVGRKMEARFQWERAKNYSDDKAMSDKIQHKISHGLQALNLVKEAATRTGENETEIFKP